MELNLKSRAGFRIWFRRGCLVAGLALAAVPMCRAQFDESRFSITGGYVSRHVFRGILRSGDCLQAGILWETGAAELAAGVNQPFASSAPSESRLSAGYRWRLGDEFTLKALGQQIWFSDGLPGANRQSTEVGVVGAWEMRSGWTPAVALYHEFRQQADTLEGSLGYSWPLTKLGAFLEMRCFLGSCRAQDLLPDDSGPKRADGYVYYGAEVRLPYRLGAYWLVELGLAYSDSWGQSRFWSPLFAAGKGRMTTSVTLTYGF